MHGFEFSKMTYYRKQFLKNVNSVRKVYQGIFSTCYSIYEINKILDTDLNSSLDKSSDIEFHNVIKKELDENPEDAKVYFEFFKRLIMLSRI